MEMLLEQARAAKEAQRILARAESRIKNQALLRVAELLEERKDALFAANQEDLLAATKAGLDAPRLDRLRITMGVLADMCAGARHVAGLDDPIGAIEEEWQRPNGLFVGKMRIPLGVVCIIYEARPNVTIDAAILCLKAGCSVILRGGSEASHSNACLAGLLKVALTESGLPADAVQFIAQKDHAAVTSLCKMHQYIDVMIPRGGEKLVASVTNEATMPVLKHFKGVCHLYVDAGCDLNQALELAYNGKVQRPGVCNALECLLVHKDIADTFLPMVRAKLNTVQFRACPKSLPLLGERAVPLQEFDLGYEFHDLILAVRIVADLDQALDHISLYGSNHTECICTNNLGHSRRFLREVDASMVGVNVSTRFNDGGQLGLGAEIGISTSKLHAYGPMGVRELTTTKFVVQGQGQVRI